jgi:cation transport ATPase
MKGAPDMNSLVAVGTMAAYLFSVVATFVPALLPDGTVNVYYEAAAVIVTLILIGRWMEARAKGTYLGSYPAARKTRSKDGPRQAGRQGC